MEAPRVAGLLILRQEGAACPPAGALGNKGSFQLSRSPCLDHLTSQPLADGVLSGLCPDEDDESSDDDFGDDDYDG